jgi:DNA-binding MarR family transcriptional regulator
VTRIYDEALAPVGLGASQHTILAELARRTEQPPTLWELADALVMDRTTITRNLRPLERDGYVTVHSSDVDRRRKLVALTAAGKDKFAEASVFWLQAQNKFERAFGATQTRVFRSQLLEIAKDSTFAAVMNASLENKSSQGSKD